MAETRSATDASHLLLAGLPPLAIFGLALVTPLALLVLLDPAAKQRIREQGLQVVILYLPAPVGINDIWRFTRLFTSVLSHNLSSLALPTYISSKTSV
jgi:uncharacterized membrane protein YqjE